MADVNVGTSALSHNVRCTTLSLMCTLLMCRFFPRSIRSNSVKPLPLYVPFRSSLLVFATLVAILKRYFCVEFFQSTPLQHFLADSKRFLYEKISSKHPHARLRIFLFSSLFAFRRLYLFSLRSSLVKIKFPFA